MTSQHDYDWPRAVFNIISQESYRSWLVLLLLLLVTIGVVAVAVAVVVVVEAVETRPWLPCINSSDNVISHLFQQKQLFIKQSGVTIIVNGDPQPFIHNHKRYITTTTVATAAVCLPTKSRQCAMIVLHSPSKTLSIQHSSLLSLGSLLL